MSVAEAIQRLQQLASRVPALPSPYPLEEPRFGPPCCEAEIGELLGGKADSVPEYVDFLRRCRRIDAADVFNGYRLFSPIGIASSDDSRPRILHVDLGAGLTEVRVIAVGSDGGGNLFLLGLGDTAAGHVWKWSHEAEVRFDGVASSGLACG